MSAHLSPIGFWSYSRQDDKASQKKLTELRELLKSELQQQYGRDPVKIFQDVSAIPPGAKWEARIRTALNDSTFFIPLITPSFIQSKWCTEEFFIFRERERRLRELHPELKDEGLIFPIWYVSVEGVEPHNPKLLTELHQLQHFDFRQLRLRDYGQDAREQIAQLAEPMCRLLRLNLGSAGDGTDEIVSVEAAAVIVDAARTESAPADDPPVRPATVSPANAPPAAATLAAKRKAPWRAIGAVGIAAGIAVAGTVLAIGAMSPHPAAAGPGAAGAAESPITLAVGFRDLSILSRPSGGIDPRQVFDTSAYELQFLEPASLPIRLSPIDVKTGQVIFDKYPVAESLKRLRAQIQPWLIGSVLLKPGAFRPYTSTFCLDRAGASWRDASQINLSCDLGGSCRASDARAVTVSACDQATVGGRQRDLAELVAPVAQAATPDDIWLTPDLAGACRANEKLNETFYRFDAAIHAPKGAESYAYSLRINGTAIAIDGRRDSPGDAPVSDGLAKVTFALQNLDFSGADGGREQIALKVTFYGAGGAALDSADSLYKFTALRAPPSEMQSGATWRGGYVIGREKDGWQIFVHSAPNLSADLAAPKTFLDRQHLVYDGGIAAFEGWPVVGIIRPALGRSPPGLGLALRGPDGRLEFTFSKGDAQALEAWYEAQRAARAPLKGMFAPAVVRQLNGSDAVTAAQAGCPKAV